MAVSHDIADLEARPAAEGAGPAGVKDFPYDSDGHKGWGSSDSEAIVMGGNAPGQVVAKKRMRNVAALLIGLVGLVVVAVVVLAVVLCSFVGTSADASHDTGDNPPPSAGGNGGNDTTTPPGVVPAGGGGVLPETTTAAAVITTTTPLIPVVVVTTTTTPLPVHIITPLPVVVVTTTTTPLPVHLITTTPLPVHIITTTSSTTSTPQCPHFSQWHIHSIPDGCWCTHKWQCKNEKEGSVCRTDRQHCKVNRHGHKECWSTCEPKIVPVEVVVCKCCHGHRWGHHCLKQEVLEQGGMCPKGYHKRDCKSVFSTDEVEESSTLAATPATPSLGLHSRRKWSHPRRESEGSDDSADMLDDDE